MAFSATSTAKGIVFALACLLLLSTMPVISNSRPMAVNALSFAFALSVWQVVFAVPVFGLELASGAKGIFSAALSVRQRWRLLAVGVLTGILFGLSTYLYVIGVEKAGAANAAIAMQAYPLFAIVLESIFLKRRKTPFELSVTLILVGALYFLGTGGTWRISGLSFWFLASLGVPLLWAVAHIIIKEELGRTPITPAQVTCFRVVISALFLFGVLWIALPGGISAGIAAIALSTSALMGLVYFLELIIWFHAVRHIDVSLASSITAPWPGLTMVLAVFFLGDVIEPYQVAALLVVVACIYALILAGLRKERQGRSTGTA